MMIVISAAGGRLGTALADELVYRGKASGVRLATRSPEKLGHRVAQGFEVVRADYEDPASLEAAYAGADIVLVISGEGANETRIAQHRNAFEAAKAAGAGRIAYTSTVNPTSVSRFGWAKAHEASEGWLTASGVPYTILRDNSYYANIAALLTQARESGTLPFPGVAAKVAYVDHGDVAGALAGALLGDGHADKIYEISGAQAYSAIDLAALLTEAAGRGVTAVDAPLAAFEENFRAMGWPDFVVEGVAGYFAAMGAGEYSATSPDVERLSGRPSIAAREYMKTLR
jgi:NAD(P)H dehydrogenase (quinone)